MPAADPDPPPESPPPGFPPDGFDRLDGEPDARFYAIPRFVTHIDEAAVAAVTALYRQTLPPGGTILDLMGSWVAHLPPEVRYRAVIGHGMNAEELAANPRYDRWFVQDLNRDPKLKLADRSVDAACLCVSFQYLRRPQAVTGELARVLRPGGAVAVSLSDRCFPTKAVKLWLGLSMAGRADYVALCLDRAGFAAVEARALLAADGHRDPLWAVTARH